MWDHQGVQVDGEEDRSEPCDSSFGGCEEKDAPPKKTEKEGPSQRREARDGVVSGRPGGEHGLRKIELVIVSNTGDN